VSVKNSAPLLSSNSLIVLSSRDLKKDELGNVVETPDELFHR
jgi:hypothetical protein